MRIAWEHLRPSLVPEAHAQRLHEHMHRGCMSAAALSARLQQVAQQELRGAARARRGHQQRLAARQRARQVQLRVHPRRWAFTQCRLLAQLFSWPLHRITKNIWSCSNASAGGPPSAPSQLDPSLCGQGLKKGIA